MNPARDYMAKVIRVRKHLLRTHTGHKSELEMWRVLTPIDRWLQFYPKASPENCLNYLRSHRSDIIALLPTNGSHAKLMAELDKICPNTPVQIAAYSAPAPTPVSHQLKLPI